MLVLEVWSLLDELPKGLPNGFPVENIFPSLPLTAAIFVCLLLPTGFGPLPLFLFFTEFSIFGTGTDGGITFFDGGIALYDGGGGRFALYVGGGANIWPAVAGLDRFVEIVVDNLAKVAELAAAVVVGIAVVDNIHRSHQQDSWWQ